jgi:hypothetical protein
MGAAWERRAMCESALRDRIGVQERSSAHIRDFTESINPFTSSAQQGIIISIIIIFITLLHQ